MKTCSPSTPWLAKPTMAISMTFARGPSPAKMYRLLYRAQSQGPSREGSVGAGTGTIAFGWKGGIGTASRKLPPSLGGYTVGVLVQSNFGGVLSIAGAPVGKELGRYEFHDQLEGTKAKLGSLRDDNADGSCMIVVATDAPVEARNL